LYTSAIIRRVAIHYKCRATITSTHELRSAHPKKIQGLQWIDRSRNGTCLPPTSPVSRRAAAAAAANYCLSTFIVERNSARVVL